MNDIFKLSDKDSAAISQVLADACAADRDKWKLRAWAYKWAAILGWMFFLTSVVFG